jgi:hypothetical protein
MKEITQYELQAISGASQRDIENWMVRLPLTTKFQQTVRGRSRTFSMDNVLEITLLARFVRSGFSPAAAAVRIRDLFDCWKRNGRTKWALFIWSDDTGLARGMSLDKAPGSQMFKGLSDIGFIYTVVDIGQICAHIEAHLNNNLVGAA